MTATLGVADSLRELESELKESVRQEELAERAHALQVEFLSDEANDVGGLLHLLTANLASDTFPRPPDGSRKLIDLSNNPNCSSRELAQGIETDPALSTAVLTHAGSAFYGAVPAGRSLSLKMAIQRIGLKGIHGIIMAEFVKGEFLRPGPGLDEIARQVWDHMVRTGPLARTIARRVGVNPDDAFTLGLMHDVGKLVLLNAVSQFRRSERRDLSLPDGFVPRAFATLHELLGAIALHNWGFAESAADVIASHHREDPDIAKGLMSEVVYLAERLDIAATRSEQLNQSEIWDKAALNMPEDLLADLFEESSPS